MEKLCLLKCAKVFQLLALNFCNAGFFGTSFAFAFGAGVCFQLTIKLT